LKPLLFNAFLYLVLTSYGVLKHGVCITDTLAALARDLGSNKDQDKERSITMLSGLTIYLEHHNVLLAAGVLDALVDVICDEHVVPQVRPQKAQPPSNTQASHKTLAVSLDEYRCLPWQCWWSLLKFRDETC
jgi:hypothetical protein